MSTETPRTDGRFRADPAQSADAVYPRGDDQALMLLRIQLFTAAQRLKGDDLDELKTLVGEIASVLGIEAKS